MEEIQTEEKELKRKTEAFRGETASRCETPTSGDITSLSLTYSWRFTACEARLGQRGGRS